MIPRNAPLPRASDCASECQPPEAMPLAQPEPGLTAANCHCSSLRTGFRTSPSPSDGAGEAQRITTQQAVVATLVSDTGTAAANQTDTRASSDQSKKLRLCQSVPQ